MIAWQLLMLALPNGHVRLLWPAIVSLIFGVASVLDCFLLPELADFNFALQIAMADIFEQLQMMNEIMAGEVWKFFSFWEHCGWFSEDNTSGRSHERVDDGHKLEPG